jgi:uncharacterized delta-60 repeat protein
METRKLLSLLAAHCLAVAAIAQSGSPDPLFDPLVGFNEQIHDVVVQSDGKLICGGNFTSYRGTAVSGIARLNTDASLDNTFNTGTGFAPISANALCVYDLELQPDGKVIIGGYFTTFNGIIANNIVRLNSNGTRDAGFVATADNGVTSMDRRSDGDIYLFGTFVHVNAAIRINVARLNSDGSLDVGFQQPQGIVSGHGDICLSRDAQGNLDGGLIAAWWNPSMGFSTGHATKLDATGAVVATFNSGGSLFNGLPNEINYSESTKGYYICGTFTQFGVNVAQHVLRLTNSGDLNATFTAGFNDFVGHVDEVLVSGNILPWVFCSGSFTTYIGSAGNSSRNGIARLSTTGVLHTGFDPGAGVTGGAGVVGTTPGPNGSRYVWGGFTTFNGVPRAGICKLSTPVNTNSGSLKVTTGPNGSETSWSFEDVESGVTLATGGGYADNSTITVNVPLPEAGALRLRFNDSGLNGMPGGGWLLTGPGGVRLIDNSTNGGCFTAQSISTVNEIRFPLGTVQLRSQSQDREDWQPIEVIQCTSDPAVTAQYGVGDQTDDGYEFQFFSPCGNYSRNVFRAHSAADGTSPNDSQRATMLALINPLPIIRPNDLLNVRVRPRVNGVNGVWGPVSRFRMPAGYNTCLPISLTPQSCGVSRSVPSGTLSTTQTWMLVSTGSPFPHDEFRVANSYTFKFQNGANTIYRGSSTPVVTLIAGGGNQQFFCGTRTYTVSVAAGFNGSSSYCPFGPTCPVTITAVYPNCRFFFGGGGGEDGSGNGSNEGESTGPIAEPSFTVWPNPSNGGTIAVALTGFDPLAEQAHVTVFDALGKNVHTQRVNLTEGACNTPLAITSLAQGLYTVQVNAGAEQRTERVVVQ